MIMVLLSSFYPMPSYSEGLIDAVLLSVLMAPVLYFFFFRSVNAVLTERGKMEAALRDDEDRFRSICSTVQDAIVLMDNDGFISYWNKAAERIFGYPEKEALGKELHSLIVPERYLWAAGNGFKKFKESGQGPLVNKLVEMEAVKKGGEEFPVEFGQELEPVDKRKILGQVSI